MKTALATLAILIATPAFADPGHFAPERGHSHWLALAAVVLAIVIGVWAVWRGNKRRAANGKVERRA